MNDTLEYYPIEAIHWAGMENNSIEKMIDILNKYPEYIHATTAYNDTPLIIAAKQSSYEMVELLLNRGAKIDAVNNVGHTALKVVAQRVNANNVDTIIPILLLLINYGASIEKSGILDNLNLHSKVKETIHEWLEKKELKDKLFNSLSIKSHKEEQKEKHG